MKAFYKIENRKLISGSGKTVPDGFSEDWSLIETLEDGSYANNYNQDCTISWEFEAKEQIDRARADIVKAVEAHIQAPIDTYNKTNSVMFKDAHSCANYKDAEGYTHQQFCIDIWNFNVSVWEVAREIEQNTLSGLRAMPTLEELVSELPVFGA